MEQPLIVAVTPEATPPAGDATAPFMAGVATVVATEAQETADVAVQQAADALTVADAANREAAEAELSAMAAHDRLDRMEEAFVELVGALGEDPNVDAVQVDDGAPPVIVPEPEPVEPETEPKPEKRARHAKFGRAGRDGWFGNRP